jgi:ubiquinone/menaquinone biosynthesis C-methylase UbiE
MAQESITRRTSTGSDLSTAAQLDEHYAFSQPEYEAMLRSIGLQPGWHVLDAGCGSGSFLTLMSEMIGGEGHLTALDLAPENIEDVNALAPKLACQLTTDIGSITELPYGNNTFNAVWSANTLILLSEKDVKQALKEFYRVVKPNGLVALKDYDMTCQLSRPIDIHLQQRAIEAIAKTGNAIAVGGLRTPDLPKYLKEIGLTDIWAQTTLTERRAPLTEKQRAFLDGIIQLFAALAIESPIPEQDKSIWRLLQDSESPEHPLNSTDFYFREGHIVTVGRKGLS